MTVAADRRSITLTLEQWGQLRDHVRSMMAAIGTIDRDAKRDRGVQKMIAAANALDRAFEVAP